MTRMKTATTTVLTAALLGCGDTPTAPEPTHPLVGTWEGIFDATYRFRGESTEAKTLHVWRFGDERSFRHVQTISSMADPISGLAPGDTLQVVEGLWVLHDLELWISPQRSKARYHETGEMGDHSIPETRFSCVIYSANLMTLHGRSFERTK